MPAVTVRVGAVRVPDDRWRLEDRALLFLHHQPAAKPVSCVFVRQFAEISAVAFPYRFMHPALARGSSQDVLVAQVRSAGINLAHDVNTSTAGVQWLHGTKPCS